MSVAAALPVRGCLAGGAPGLGSLRTRRRRLLRARLLAHLRGEVEEARALAMALGTALSAERGEKPDRGVRASGQDVQAARLPERGGDDDCEVLRLEGEAVRGAVRGDKADCEVRAPGHVVPVACPPERGGDDACEVHGLEARAGCEPEERVLDVHVPVDAGVEGGRADGAVSAVYAGAARLDGGEADRDVRAPVGEDERCRGVEAASEVARDFEAAAAAFVSISDQKRRRRMLVDVWDAWDSWAALEADRRELEFLRRRDEKNLCAPVPVAPFLTLGELCRAKAACSLHVDAVRYLMGSARGSGQN